MNEQQLNLTLVGEVEKHPVLYNYKLPGYSRKDETEKAWREVAKEVSMSVATCKKRWKNIRAVFVRNLKPLRRGSGPKKAYYLLQAMQFTIPYIKTLTISSGKLPNISKQEEDADQFWEIDFEKKIADEPETSSISQKLTCTTSAVPSSPVSVKVPQITETSQNQIHPQRKVHNSPVLKNDTVDNALIGYLQVKENKRISSEHTHQNRKTEGLKMFLLSMLPDLEQMSDEQVRQFKRQVLEVVDDIISNRPMISSKFSSSSRSEITLIPKAGQVTEVTETPLFTTLKMRDMNTETLDGTSLRAEKYYEVVDDPE